MSNEPNSESEESNGQQPDIELDDPPGRWDNRIAYFIAASPVILVLLALATLAASVLVGIVRVDFTISGTLPVTEVWNGVVEPFLLVVILGFAAIWLLSVMSWFGANAVIRIGGVIEQMIRDYGGER
jgi:hypothetical protein